MRDRPIGRPAQVVASGFGDEERFRAPDVAVGIEATFHGVVEYGAGGDFGGCGEGRLAVARERAGDGKGGEGGVAGGRTAGQETQRTRWVEERQRIESQGVLGMKQTADRIEGVWSGEGEANAKRWDARLMRPPLMASPAATTPCKFGIYMVLSEKRVCDGR